MPCHQVKEDICNNGGDEKEMGDDTVIQDRGSLYETASEGPGVRRNKKKWAKIYRMDESADRKIVEEEEDDDGYKQQEVGGEVKAEEETEEDMEDVEEEHIEDGYGRQLQAG